MKNLLFSFLVFGAFRVSGQNVPDSVIVDKVKIKEVIQEIKKKWMSPRPGFNPEDVHFNYPAKALRKEDFNIYTTWKGETYITYYIDPETYNVTGAVDLR